MIIRQPAEMVGNSTAEATSLMPVVTTGAPLGNPGLSPLMQVWVHIIYISAPMIFFVGIVGNSLTVVVMVRSSFRRLNTSVYLTALALADTICLFCQRLTRSWLEFVFNLLIDVISKWGCKALMFVHFSMSCTSSWLIVAMTLERLIVVWEPLKAKRICTRRRALAVVCLVYFLSCAANTYTFFTFDMLYEPSDGYYYCLQQNERNQLISTLVDFCLYSFFPSLFLLSSNILLIWKIKQSQKMQRALTIGANGNLKEEASRKKTNTNIMLLGVSFTFLALTTPTALFQLVQSLVKFPTTEEILIIREILNVLSSANHAINFFLYCISGPKFRSELCRIFGRFYCRKSVGIKQSSTFTSLTALENSKLPTVKSIYTIHDNMVLARFEK